jgi:hypothetical protein
VKWILLTVLATSNVYANLEKAPTKFKSQYGNSIYVDFKTVKTNIDYKLKANTAVAKTTIQFEADKSGLPIFDLIPSVTSAKLDGISVDIKEISSPNNITKYKLVNKIVSAGLHTLEIENTVTDNVKFSRDSVKSAFWMSDLNDRKYIERYIPTNIEFDQYQLDLSINIVGDKKALSHEVFTNGTLTHNANNQFTISFPEYFSASSFYFHLSPKDAFKKDSFNFKSISGKDIPVVIYSRSSWSLSTSKRITVNTLNELEKKLGAWSHPSFTAYIAGNGGMEHSGATITSNRALAHEITHSYFARGVMPIDGNSGWMDEAIASWRDDGYQSTSSPNFNSTTMSGHSEYKRSTDRKAYTQGANFMAYLNFELKSHGGLITFLKHMYTKFSHKNINTNIFKRELETFSGRDFSAEFNQYIYGLTHVNDTHTAQETKNPNHPHLTKQDLLNLL